MRGFVHLHLHTNYSLLSGACSIQKLATRAAELGMPAVAITDYGNMFAAYEFFQTMMKAGVKPIIGCDIYFLPEGKRKERDPRYAKSLTHLTLLAKNINGYKNLCRMVSNSYLEGFYYKPRVDLELLTAYSEDLIALSGGMTGPLAKLLLQDKTEEAHQQADALLKLFDGRFYVELVNHCLPEEEKVTDSLLYLAKQKGLPLVATNDVHYLHQEDAESFDVLMCIKDGKTIHDDRRQKMQNDEYYFKSPLEMGKLFQDHPEALDNTIVITDSIDLDLNTTEYHFPHFEPPQGQNLEAFLESESRRGLDEKLSHLEAKGELNEEKRKVYLDRLERELGIIKQMGFAGYFLIVADFISFARKSSLPVGPGRGSAAGSLVAYVMGITNIDPLLHDLLFERFLNPERISMPDVDIDFCMRRRDEVIDYVAQKYGNVAQIITFGKMKAKAGIRDVGRVLGLPYADVDRIAKLVPDTLGTTLQTALEQEPKLVDAMKKDPQIAKLIEIAKKLEGYPRHASTHAAGVVIGDKELTEYLPLSKGQNDEVITQFDMKAVESVGLIKFDFLGLKTLTVIDDTLQLIQKHRGETLNIDDIPLDDELVYQKLSEGDTLGIFQLEGQGMTELILKLKPSSFEDIVALVALFRPGPLGSGMVDDFIDRKHGRKAIEYSLPHLAPILKDTYGVIVYQEQVMRIASELAGFSLGDADLLRRAMGKKKPEEMEKQREKFLEGAKKNEIPDAKAEFIFDLMAKFAEYGFNKSHSAAYALVSYQTAYLKFHYPTEYMAAIMTCDQGSTDKVLPYIADCKTHAIQVLPPDVNESVKDFSVIEEGIIRFGLGAVKNVGAAAIESIVHEREKTEAYRSLHDFCRRVDTRKVNKRVLESLIKCGAFDFIKTTRASLFSGLDHALEMAFSHQRDRLSGQVSFFDTFNSSDTEFTEEKLPELPEWQEKERLSYEKETLGLYITGHPLHQYELLLKTYATSNTLSVQEVKKNKEVRVGGLVSRMKEIMTRKGDRMAFVTLEDLQGTVELVVFSDLYSEASDLIKSDEPLFVTGLAESDGETVKIIAKDICSVDEVAINFTKSVHFYLDTKQVQSSDLDELKKMLTQHKGSCPSFLHFLTDGKTETVLSLPPQLYVMPSRELAHDISHRFGEDVMKFTTV